MPRYEVALHADAGWVVADNARGCVAWWPPSYLDMDEAHDRAVVFAGYRNFLDATPPTDPPTPPPAGKPRRRT